MKTRVIATIDFNHELSRDEHQALVQTLQYLLPTFGAIHLKSDLKDPEATATVLKLVIPEKKIDEENKAPTLE
jgi:hypothetical protein